MKAVVCSGHGGPEVLRLREIPPPDLGPGQVRIDVVAAGVNRADLLQRRGLYPPPPDAPETLGLECAGRVIEVGSHVRRWSPGDRVMALLAGGGYADEAVVPTGCLLPVPDTLGIPEAAAIPEALATLEMAVFDLGRLAAGNVLLLHGGSGGVGSLGVQLAAASGATVVATAGSPERCRRCEEIGADRAVDYHTGDFADAVHDVSRGTGADVILDCVGADYLGRHLQMLAIDGRLVVIGLQGGRTTEIDLAALLKRRLHLVGTTLRSRPPTEKARLLRRAWRRFGGAFATGAVRPVVARRFPVERAAEAHELVASGSAFGKVVLTFGKS